MAIKMRLSRGGRKKSPYYRIVVADVRAPRDGKYIERVGRYNPLLAKGDEGRVVLDTDKVKAWLDKGAQPTERVAILLGQAGIIPMPEQSNRPQKSQPKAKAQERLKEKEEKAAAAKEAEEQAAAETEANEQAAAAEAEQAEAPAAEEAPAEETAAEEAPAEEVVAEETPAEDADDEENKG